MDKAFILINWGPAPKPPAKRKQLPLLPQTFQNRMLFKISESEFTQKGDIWELLRMGTFRYCRDRNSELLTSMRGIEVRSSEIIPKQTQGPGKRYLIALTRHGCEGGDFNKTRVKIYIVNGSLF